MDGRGRRARTGGTPARTVGTGRTVGIRRRALAVAAVVACVATGVPTAATATGPTATVPTATVPAAPVPVHRCSEQDRWPRGTAPYVIAGDLVGDVSCDVRDVHVRGAVRVAPDTHLNLWDSEVDGRVEAVGALDLIGTTVHGDVRMTGGAGMATLDARVDGSVHTYGRLILDGTSVGGDVVAVATGTEPWLRVVLSDVGGHLVGTGGVMTVVDSRVAGHATLGRWSHLRVCGGAVGRDLLLVAGVGPGSLGDPTCGGEGPRVGRSLVAVRALQALTVRETPVQGDVRCVASPGVVLTTGVTVGGTRDPRCRTR